MAQIVGLGAAAAAFLAILIRHWYVRRHPVAPAGDEPAPASQAESEPAPAA
jgi:hypothetical protein